MDYCELVDVYEKLVSTTSRLEKTELLSDFFKTISSDQLKIIPHLITGDIFSEWDVELGVGPGLFYNAVSFVTGVNKKDIENTIRVKGDTGLAVKELFENRPQKTLFSKKLLLEDVYNNFNRIATAKGSGAQNKKIKYLSDLLSNASPLEAMYITKTVLSELRIGVAEGIIRDAIASAFSVDVKAVELAFMLTNDLGLVAQTSFFKGVEGLNQLRVSVGTPLRPMLAQSISGLDEAFKDKEKVALEIKYDGARVQIHKKKDSVRIFSRRLEEVTDALPDVVEGALKSIQVSEAIVDGETVAVDPKNGRPKPFQDILRRFRRKYNVEEKVGEIPFETYIFDILYSDGELHIDKPFKTRRKILEKTFSSEENGMMIAKQVITDKQSEAQKFYENALKSGHEGVMVKNLDASYVIGSRVGYMYKVKPISETLDLVVIGALWGEGKRVGWLSSYHLGARDELGDFKYVGRVATGVTEQQLEELTDVLRPLIEYEDGLEVKIVPKIVVEVGYQEIQRSPKYDSGFALRFPKVIQVREDKGTEEVDTLERIEDLYKKQRT